MEYEKKHIFDNIIGQSDPMKEIFSIVEKVSNSNTTIIINGETGTGKGLIARAIHESSDRNNNPFIQINCGAISEGLLESELFGHVKGAFTGAIENKPGKFELAERGSIFLDEIGDMSTDLQVKVLRVLEENEFEPVGGSKTIKANVRVIAATHRDLEEEVQKGNFREDLFYRLYVIPMVLPPLKEKKSDLPLLVSHFLDLFCRGRKGHSITISNEALEIFMNYSWPGNVRELKNLIERLVVLSESAEITPRDLPKKLKTIKRPEIDVSAEGVDFNTAVTEYEKTLIINALEKTNWVKNKAANFLQIKRTTLVEKIKRHKINKEV
ncbi:MAG: sigma-54 dependent transcriptional regulator [Desulfobacterales bacterium]|nr:sigma-54 dependent transcriptional regulator [Desulfobacterales bacterium]MDX2508949.1 sigma-54 dependent transcriptional regulator [Desulfobacterales bacterium]